MTRDRDRNHRHSILALLHTALTVDWPDCVMKVSGRQGRGSCGFGQGRVLLTISVISLLLVPVQCLLKEYKIPVQSKKKYYIYDWPESLVNLWPTMQQSTSELKVTSHLNYGTGSLVDPSIGMFDAFQYGLLFLSLSVSLLDSEAQ
jgi:hypothetical protein